ncbi:hypothetical protein Y032_0098g3073 [Ancylostoma ceylanicum]|uniref:Uncharacterized protein n=1 Tax=Ancylostoma ceylanicum TaxID=53326 RepID=A0A016TIZ2_9BILA|nr:hypothetical protein Y032_0098g3073 [Ancylostoma ceylanicum]
MMGNFEDKIALNEVDHDWRRTVAGVLVKLEGSTPCDGKEYTTRIEKRGSPLPVLRRFCAVDGVYARQVLFKG